MTLGMVRFTWHIVSVLLVAFGALLMTLVWAPEADAKTLLLRWFVAFLLAATALACWEARRRPRSLLRLSVPLVFVVIAVLCWTAST
jgi:4-amino-4-deoxy-L-arabinose transferase-like glycosyltransferase